MRLPSPRVLLTLAVIGLVLCGPGLAGVAFATEYYVATTGSDSNPGTVDQPWLTITQAGNTMVAGDTCYVRGGTYNGSTNHFWPANSGTASQPITLRAYAGETPTLTGAGLWDAFIFLNGKQYITIDGLYSNNTTGYNVISMADSTHCTIRNCHFSNHAGTTINLNMGGYHLVEDCTFDTCGDPAAEGSGDHIYVCGSDYNLIQDNYFTKAGHATIDFIDYNNMAYLSEYNIVRNNTIEQHWGSGIGLIRSSTHIVLENNKIYYVGEGVTTYPKSGIMCVSDQNIVRNNIIAWTSAGPVRDNALTFEAYSFGGVDQHSRDNCVYNNTIYKAGKEAVMVTQRFACQLTRNQFLNNILYYCRVGGPYEEWIDPDANYYFIFETYHSYANNKWPYFANDNVFHHNIIRHADATGDKPGEDPILFYDQESFAGSLSETQAAYPGAFWGNLDANPGFANAEGGDFHLQAGSAAIDAGDFLTRTSAAGSNTTTLPVLNANYFSDGFGLVTGDQVKVGSNSPVTVTDVNYTAKTLTVSSPISFSSNAPVSLPYQSSAPDLGAFESSGGGSPPVANFIGNPTSGTAPLSVAFTDTSTNSPTQWSWTFGDGGTSTAQNPSHTYTGAGNYTVSLTAANSAGSDDETKNNYISVAAPPAPPVANFTGTPTTGTAPLAVSFTDTSTGSPTSWSWTFGDGGTSTVQHPSHTYAAGAFTVSLTATNAGGSDGETKTNYITVTVAPPVANFTGAPTTGPAPLAVSFTDTSTGSPTSWSWSFGDSTTSTAQNPSHTYAAGAFTVSLTATNAGGSDGETKTDYITTTGAGSMPTFVAAGAVASGTGAITPALPAGIATNDILLLSLETANQAISISNQNGGAWAEVTGSPQGTGTAGGTAATRLTVFWSRYNGTQGAPTTSDSGNHQAGRIIAIRGAATSGNPWDVTAGGVESTADTSGSIPGATTTVANTLVVVAIATSLPDSSITTNFSAWTNATLSSLTERTDNTRSAGNGGGLATATGGKAAAGAYGSTAVTCATAAAKGLLSIALKPAAGGGAPVANFIGTPTIGAAPLAVSFTDTSTNTPTAWSWTFGDSSTSTVQNPSHTYAAGTYTVSLIATNAYGSDGETKNNYITAGNPPVASFTGTPTIGAAPLAVTFTDTSTNSPTSWSWTFGDGGTSTAQHPSHTYNSTGGCTVSLTATNAYGSDGETKTNYITVIEAGYYPATSWSQLCGTLASGAIANAQTSDNTYLQLSAPSPGFKTGGRFTIATGLTPAQVSQFTVQVEYHTSRTDATGNLTLTMRRAPDWVGYDDVWQAPGFTTSDTWVPEWSTTAVSTYMDASGVVTLEFGGGCSLTTQSAWDLYLDTVRLHLDLVSPPVANFTGTPTSGPAPLAVSFTDTSTNGPTAWSWTFGDGATSTAQNPSHTYAAGAYTVSLTATNAAGSDGETKTDYITATVPPPVANFTGTPTSGSAPLAVSFTDTSTNSPTSWSWTFGDGSTSTAQNPGHTYAAGAYTVSLTATNAGGSDGETKTDYITASGPTEVYVYPDQYELTTGAALISGGLADLQSSNDVYMRVRCNTSTHNGGVRYWWHTSYTPAQVNQITVEYEYHATYTTTPEFEFLIYNQSGSFDGMWAGLGLTTDQWFTWSSTNVSAYLSSSGVIYTTACGCGQNTNNWDTYLDVVRVKLTLN